METFPPTFVAGHTCVDHNHEKCHLCLLGDIPTFEEYSKKGWTKMFPNNDVNCDTAVEGQNE
jgi:hypothetical protein